MDAFLRLRSISTLYGYLHSLGLIDTDNFTRTVYKILKEYTTESLELLMILAIDLLSRGLFTGMPDANLNPVYLWEDVTNLTRHLKTGKGDEVFKHAAAQFEIFTNEFDPIVDPVIRAVERLSDKYVPFRQLPPLEGSTEFGELQRFCRDVESLIIHGLY